MLISGIVQAIMGAINILEIATYMSMKGIKFKEAHSPVKRI
jgi:argininosuccinate lyase